MLWSLERKARTLVTASWLIFLASFVLPATNALQAANTPPNAPLTGWHAFAASQYAVAANPLLVIAEPRVILFLIFPIANAFMLLAPALCSILRDKSAALALLFVPCSIIPWIMPREMLGDLYIGFYCWNGSFLAMSCGCVLASLVYDAADNEGYDSEGRVITR